MLRKIVAGIRRQDWAAVVIELIVVVAGVFVGIQVANWNTARVDHLRAHGYLERIHANLEVDIASSRKTIDFWSKVSAYGAQGLAHADGRDAAGVDPWEMLLAFFQASQTETFGTARATYDELKSAGELGLIADAGLRGQLIKYYSGADNSVLNVHPAYRERVRGKIPLDIQLYIWERCYSVDVSGEQELHDCKSPIDRARAAGIVDSISGDEALMSELRYWMSTLHVATLIAADRAHDATTLRDAVAQRIDGDDP